MLSHFLVTHPRPKILSFNNVLQFLVHDVNKLCICHILGPSFTISSFAWVCWPTIKQYHALVQIQSWGLYLTHTYNGIIKGCHSSSKLIFQQSHFITGWYMIFNWSVLETSHGFTLTDNIYIKIVITTAFLCFLFRWFQYWSGILW